MALFYFPKNTNLGLRNAWDSTYQELIIACNPNAVFFFDTSSVINSMSASYLDITSSWALTASVTTLLISSSYADTAAFALNAAAGGASSASAYITTFTSSTNWITASFANSEQYVTITTTASYNFTCSGVPAANTSSNLSLFIYNTSTTGTSSLSFPPNWIFIGLVPTYLTSSKSAILSLKALGNQIIAAWGAQY